jgi:hypothetical protein
MGRDHLARSAPSCPKVNNHGLIAVDLHISGILTQVVSDEMTYESLEFLVRFDSLDHCEVFVYTG